MNIIAVDDEQFALQDLKLAIEAALQGNAAYSDSNISLFSTAKAALEYAKNNHVDIAFLDIEVGRMNGLELAKRLKDIAAARNVIASNVRQTYVIFVTGFSQYAVDAFSLHASGYILKPVNKKRILEALNHVGVQPVKQHTGVLKLQVQTFGNFEVFINGKPLCFARKKTKELFAYLVSRKGALCSTNEIAAILWENKDDSPSLQSSVRQLVGDLTKTLNDAGINDVLHREWGNIAIVPDKISCDFYDFCSGINVNNYMGEFMTQYGWGEFTNSYLDKMYKNK